jgi:hypothetical protein
MTGWDKRDALDEASMHSFPAASAAIYGVNPDAVRSAEDAI